MNYKQLINYQKHQIESYLKAGYSITKIAGDMGVHKSTNSRELKRNNRNASTMSILILQLVKNVVVRTNS